jgi:hypothetical protein
MRVLLAGTTGGSQPPDVLAAMAAQNVEVDEQVLLIAARTWAIPGRIAYDGEVIVATFDDERTARAALVHARSSQSR